MERRTSRNIATAIAGRITVCTALLMALSAQTNQQWVSELAVPGMSTLYQAPLDESEIVWGAEPFAGSAPVRFTTEDETALWEVLVYEQGPYRAEIIYWKNRPGYSLIYTNMGFDPDNPTGWSYFDGKRITPAGSGLADTALGEIEYQRFMIPGAACFRFQQFWEYRPDWEDRTRMLGGYVCSTEPAGLIDPDIAVFLASLGVRDNEPDPVRTHGAPDQQNALESE